MLRRKLIEEWTDKHRNVMRKLLVEGCCVQRRLYDIGWSDEKKCRGCNKEEGTACSSARVGRKSEATSKRNERKWEQRARTSKERFEVAKRKHDASVE